MIPRRLRADRQSPESCGWIEHLSFLSDWKPVFWILAGFLAGYYLINIMVVYLNPDQVMKFYPSVTTLNPIGYDLILNNHLGQAFREGYYISGPYPPLPTVLLFAPLSFLGYSAGYKIITLLNYLGYFYISFLIPVLMLKSKQGLALGVFFYLTGLVSNGFQFELERGQFNILTMALCLSAIYLFHRYPKLSYLSYFLFSISVQFKLWPAIFIVMFVRDWREWKTNLKRAGIIIGMNIILLFSLGVFPVITYWKTIIWYYDNTYVWMGNHSIRSFSELFLRYLVKLHIITPAIRFQFQWLLQAILYGFILLCLGLIILSTIKKKKTGLNTHLMIACTIGALLIPATSSDYVLAILAGPMAIAFNNVLCPGGSRKLRLVVNLWIFGISLAYTATMFIDNIKPLFIQNNLPVLMFILISFTGFALLEGFRVPGVTVPAE